MMIKSLLLLLATTATLCGAQVPSMPVRRGVESIRLQGSFNLPGFTTFESQFVGGLSGIAFDGTYYYLLSDDEEAPRFYTATISVRSLSVDIIKVTPLKNENGGDHFDSPIDPEGIAYSDGVLYVASGGQGLTGVPPAVLKFGLDGIQIGPQFDIPSYFRPNSVTTGINANKGLDTMTVTPDGSTIYTALENALLQDGPGAPNQSLCRVLKYSTKSSTSPMAEVVYITEEGAGNGLTDLLALDDNGSFLSLERSEDSVKLFYVLGQGALDVSGIPDLFWEEEGIPFEIDPPVQKFELDVDLPYANYEGMVLGPLLFGTASSYPLILVSDNGFEGETTITVMIVTFDSIGLAFPSLETKGAVDDQGLAVEKGLLAGDSDDPAIWLHPTDPSMSLVMVTLKDGGMVVYDLYGNLLQSILPAPFGDIRYNNVDILYAYEKADGSLVDLAIASDRARDTLVIWSINPATRRLTDMTSTTDMVETIFGVDDGEATAYGLTTYSSLLDGTDYVFVTQADGNLVAQLELFNDASGRVGAMVVRTIELPIPDGGEAGDSQSEGLVVDRNAAALYVAIEGEFGILKFDAEPEGGSRFLTVAEIDGTILSPDIEGLTIYYQGFFGEGYLLASSQGDSSFAVFDLLTNDFIDSFAIGDSGDIDQTNESDGVDILNSYLGPSFPCGLMVAEDGANDPQIAVEDDEELENSSTNFKFVPYESVTSAIDSLTIDPLSWGPRRHALELRSASILRSIQDARTNGMVATGVATTLEEMLVSANILLLDGSSAVVSGGHRHLEAYKKFGTPIRRRGLYRDENKTIDAQRRGLKGEQQEQQQRRKLMDNRKGKKGKKMRDEHEYDHDDDKDDDDKDEKICGFRMRGRGAAPLVKDAFNAFVERLNSFVSAGSVPSAMAATWRAKATAIINAVPEYYF